MRRVALFVVVLLAVTAADIPSGSGRDLTPSAGQIATRTEVVPPPPTRVVLIGDSIMGEVAAAAQAAAGDRVDIDYVLTIGTANVTDDWWDVWPRVLAEHRPQAVAVLVGPWEIDRPDLGSYPWAVWYGERLERWADQLRAGGADLHWFTALPARDPVVDARLGVFNGALQRLRDRRPVTLLDSALALGQPGYVERAPDGARFRRVDGLHLCPAGAARLAVRLLDELGIVPTPGWEQGSWTTVEPAYSPVECPA